MAEPEKKKDTKFDLHDVMEIVLGGSVIAFPVATASEIWDLGVQLSVERAVMISLSSLLVLGVLIYTMHQHTDVTARRRIFIQRVLTTYGLTLLISATLLLAIGQFDLIGDPMVALKRTILVAFPASFAATVVDSMDGNR